MRFDYDFIGYYDEIIEKKFWNKGEVP